jgi:hypothetical protein
MAGISSEFDADGFRAAIRNVEEIFAPPLEAERATFFFPHQLVYTDGTDADDVPFDRDAVPVVTQVVPSVQVPCSVAYFDSSGALTDFGILVPSRAELTFLDEDYHRVDGSVMGTSHFSYVALRGEKFVYRSTEFPTGLFDVGIYVVHVAAEDQR